MSDKSEIVGKDFLAVDEACKEYLKTIVEKELSGNPKPVYLECKKNVLLFLTCTYGTNV